MKFSTVLANTAWAAGNLGAARRFAAALREPEAAQGAWLKGRLAQDAKTSFGQEHGFGGLGNYSEFARRVPLRGWAEFAPWIKRIRSGDTRVLSRDRVTHLAPTSGSSGARKLIPFTTGLQAGFSAAVGAWMHDLVRTEPGLLGGPSYWSVSPLVDGDGAESDGKVPVGFADDAEYLGGVRAWLVRQALAVPADVRHERDLERFWLRTLGGLLARRDLRLISVWHPSFLDLLLAAAERHWEGLCDGVVERSRAAELRRLGPKAYAQWWPQLRVVSCWGEQAAEPGWRELQRKFPGVRVQAKGLLATEAAVTIPWGGTYPLAVTSHFFEFIDPAGGVRRAHELARGEHYQLVVTNGGGLWRYRLGDVVECTGWLAATPTLRFLGRSDNVSDLRGEKLSETFVAEVVRGLWAKERDRPKSAVLRACEGTEKRTAGYELAVVLCGKVTSEELAGWGARLETALAANPHYALARRLGQLAPVRVVDADAAAEAMRLQSQRGRLGDVKPQVLVGWKPEVWR